jgi:hypothetical protein
MYSCQEDISIRYLNQLSLLGASKFRQNVTSISFCDPFNSPSISSWYHHLKKTTTNATVPELFQTLSLIPNLSKLKIFNLSNIAQLQRLESLRLCFPNNNKSLDANLLIDAIRLLPALQTLDVDGLFPIGTENGLMNLRRLCEQPGAPPTLRNILSFSNYIPYEDQVKCAHLLQQLSSLDKIELDSFYRHELPICFVKWIHIYEARHLHYFESNITHLSLFKRLESITLDACMISDIRMSRLINAHASRLKRLIIFNDFSLYVPSMNLSFTLISQCVELQVLHLTKCGGLLASEFQNLSNCKKLESILLFGCGLTMNDLSLDQQEAVKLLPSKIFPYLMECEIK